MLAKKPATQGNPLATGVDGGDAGWKVLAFAMRACRCRVSSGPLSRGLPRRVVSVGPDRRDGRTPWPVCPVLSIRDVYIGRGTISRPAIRLERRRATGISGVAASRADTFARPDRLYEVQERSCRGDQCRGGWPDGVGAKSSAGLDHAIGRPERTSGRVTTGPAEPSRLGPERRRSERSSPPMSANARKCPLLTAVVR